MGTLWVAVCVPQVFSRVFVPLRRDTKCIFLSSPRFLLWSPPFAFIPFCNPYLPSSPCYLPPRLNLTTNLLTNKRLKLLSDICDTGGAIASKGEGRASRGNAGQCWVLAARRVIKHARAFFGAKSSGECMSAFLARDGSGVEGFLLFAYTRSLRQSNQQPIDKSSRPTNKNNQPTIQPTNQLTN